MSSATETLPASSVSDIENNSPTVHANGALEDTKPLRDSPDQGDEDVREETTSVMNDIFGEDDSSDREDSNDEPEEEQDNFEEDQESDGDFEAELRGKAGKKKTTKKTTKKKKADKEEKPKTKRKPRTKKSEDDTEGEGKKKKRKAAKEPKDPAPKKRKTGRTDEEKLVIVQDIITRMQDAREQDLKAFQDHKPSLKKIQLLKQIENTLVNRSLEKTFMENKILHEIAQWMKPMPDRSLPNITIREFALKFLSTISYQYISPTELKSSEVGKFIRLYSQSKKETDANRDAATRIAERMVAFLKAEQRFGVGSAY